ncbi:GNAT family N-acetyltransferase [Halorubrum sp. DTA98]|uniref:GNAT family N-acetyltransferase n=1 Tax=Halorubrum sp. DTA98 TaxID=3402163 RepID=UPI003AAD1811
MTPAHPPGGGPKADPDHVRVTPATADDIEAVTDRWVELASSQREYGSTLLSDGNRETVRDSVARGVVTGELFVARDDADRIVGFVGFSLDHGGLDRDRRRGVVDNLYVDPDRRGDGIGSALLSAAERALRSAGATEVGLEAMTANDRARSFYRSHGYEPHRVVLRKRIDEAEIDDADHDGGDTGGTDGDGPTDDE